MTRADLMGGDRPWRIGVQFRSPSRWELVGLVLAAVTAFLLPVGLWCAVMAVCGWRAFRPQVVLYGGGRRPLSSTEWREWAAHIDLTVKEAEHAAKVRG